MATPVITRCTRPQRVEQRLRRLILGPGLAPGDRLEPMSALARRFGVSVPTVQAALDSLEGQGLVVKRQGSGTFLASHPEPLRLADSVLLCVESRGDVWGELTSFLLHGLHGQGRFVSLIDTAHAKSADLIRRTAHSDVACLVIHGNRHFPFTALRAPELRRKPVISVVDWEPPAGFPDVHRVLIDYRAGARQVARHLWRLGHRRALVVGSAMQIDYFAAPSADSPHALPRALREAWDAAGGQWVAMASVEEGERVAFPTDKLLSVFAGERAPTAVIGLRDVEALAVQRVLAAYRPALARHLGIVGFYDTPWAVMGDPPITAVHLDLERIARKTVQLVEAFAAAPPGKPALWLIPPRLIVRGTSVSVGGQRAGGHGTSAVQAGTADAGERETTARGGGDR